MSDVSRFSVSMERDLQETFDDYSARHGYQNRSEAIRDLVRHALVRDRVRRNETVAATLTMVFRHEMPALRRKATRLQHASHGLVISTLHVHLDDDLCLEVLVMKGGANRVRKLADRLLASRGVLHGELVVTGA